MAPHPIPLPCAFTFPPPSHRDATTPSPCWAPRFMTQELFMFSNPTPIEPRRLVMPRHHLSLRSCTAPLSCSLQHLLKLSLFSPRPSLLQFVRIVSPHSPSLRFCLPAKTEVYGYGLDEGCYNASLTNSPVRYNSNNGAY